MTDSQNGVLGLEELSVKVKGGEIETILVMFTDMYGRFMGKRLDAQYFLDHVCGEGVNACNYLLSVDMEMEPVSGYDFASWELGYGDFTMKPDLNTLRVATWLEKSAIILCDLVNESTGDLIALAPRSVLRGQLSKLDEMNYSAFAASELEFYIFDEPYRSAFEKGYRDLRANGWYLEDYHMMQGTRHEKLLAPVRRHLRNAGIKVESSKGEWGIGQHELNVRFSDALDMADQHVILKQCLKETADQMDMSVTFMAKYSQDAAGSSCHIHVNLSGPDGNAFAGDSKLGSISCSDIFRWFLAGWIAHVPDVMVFYAPTVNSYKRYQTASWAPTNLAWSHDNRTAGFRIVGSGKSLRIECRIPGADCNVYLAFAATLASGLDGVRKKMEPPDEFTGDAYAAADIAQVPTTLTEAVELFENSDFAREAFGEDVVKHYTHFYRTEQKAYNTVVTDWEHQSYFERI